MARPGAHFPASAPTRASRERPEHAIGCGSFGFSGSDKVFEIMTVRKIAYQGEPGANSHIACQNVYPDWEPLACDTFEDALSAIAEGEAGLGMIPIENSIAGRVADIHHLLPSANLHVVGEYFLPIHFQLLGLKGAKLGDVKSVHSHVHALGQCRKIIRKLRLSPHVSADTAGSAREVAEWGDPARASIATSLAADIYGLEVLAGDIEDEPNNTTRFVILSKTPRWAEPSDEPTVTSFVFRVRNVPAALYKALGGFATNGVNMTKLESYMVEGQFTATQFLADVDGHPDEPALARALEELAFFCKELKILGVYRAHPYRILSQTLDPDL
ncbi:Prephenate dehydratase [Methylocella tundrae]|uniref:prephenate dehydratase n=2 Tax=Methylocella tundrae TaxID=227605 RepID=A0A4U8Z6F6_METTU|nr:Prephenate dehydratase [Methylocella tundrae]